MNAIISHYTSKLYSWHHHHHSTIISRCMWSFSRGRRTSSSSNNADLSSLATPKQRILAPTTLPLQQSRLFHSSQSYNEKDTVKVTFIDPMGVEKTVDAQIGKNLLEIAHDHNIELEGACGGELACATCHLIFEKEIYDTLPSKEPEEDDMLDLAMELTDTSRLGCQICVRKDMDGMKVRIPDDGY